MIPDNSSSIDRAIISCVLRYVVVAVFGLHFIPILFYSIFYKKSKVVVEVTLGVLSFLFFTPSYLIIFNIYALCRIDDISWGTKGRDEDKQGENKMKQKWRKIKIVYVLKYIFWNTAVTTFFLHVE